MSLDTVKITARTAARLRVAADDAEVVAAVDSAVFYVATWTGHPAAELPADDPLAETGAVLLAVRIFQDTGVPSGALDAYADPTLSGATIPEHLDRHLVDYFTHLVAAWGTA